MTQMVLGELEENQEGEKPKDIPTPAGYKSRIF